MKWTALILLGLIIASVAAAPRMMRREGDDDDDKEDDDARQITADLSADGTSVMIVSTTDKNTLTFLVTTKGGNNNTDLLAIYAWLENDIGGNGDTDGPESQSRLLFHQLQEFNDAACPGGDGTPDDDKLQQCEKVGNPYEIGVHGFDPIVQTFNSTDGSFTWTISEKAGPFVPRPFTAVLHLSPTDEQRPNGEEWHPSTMKIDVLIQGFPYTTTTNYLALLTEFRNDGPLKATCDAGVFADTSKSDPFAALRWIKTFTNGLVTGNVACDIESQADLLNNEGIDTENDPNFKDERAAGIWFSFSIADALDIRWDPEYGVHQLGENTGGGGGGGGNNNDDDDDNAAFSAIPSYVNLIFVIIISIISFM
jgi:hypothetical protein